MYKAIKLPSFAVAEHDGVILAWAGEGTPPPVTG